MMSLLARVGLGFFFTVFILRAFPAAADDRGAEVERLRDAAKRAAGTGDRETAFHHLERAIEMAPDSTDAFLDLLELCKPDADLREMWLGELCCIASDEKGRLPSSVKLGRELKSSVDRQTRLTRARADALDGVARQAKKLRGSKDRPLATWLLEVGRALWSGSPALAGKFEPVFEAAIEKCEIEPRSLVSKLAARVSKCSAEGEVDEALIGARLLLGLATQAGRSKLDLPECEKWERTARQTIAKCRATMKEGETPMTVDDLEVIKGAGDWPERRASWNAPAVVISPNGRYRIESVCGPSTTYHAARYVEKQHERLARWYGRDPFEDVQGTLRLCSNAFDLEREGQNHWWVRGFQSGDLTATYASFLYPDTFAGILTHELTHRFDGEIHGNLPEWLLEGRAVHAEVCTTWLGAPELDERMVDTHRLWLARNYVWADWKPGRTAAVALEEILRGETDDYRHYYAIGYSIWLYLTKFRADHYGAQIAPFLQSFRTQPKKDPVERFTHYFADGKDGRPDGFEAWTDGLMTFLTESNASPVVDWVKAWQGAMIEARRESWEARQKGKEKPEDMCWAERVWMQDPANYPEHRDRHREPAFGEGHAFDLARWFDEAGLQDEALEALEWSFQVDEHRSRNLAWAAGLRRRTGQNEAAWAHALRAHAIDPIFFPAPESEPGGAVSATWKAVRVALNAWKEAAAELADEGLIRSARVAKAEHDRLSRTAGLPPAFGAEESADHGPSSSAPDCPPFAGLIPAGLTTATWCPEDTTPSDSWHIPAPDKVVMGAGESKDAVSGLARDAIVRRLFLVSPEWFDGDYTVRARFRMLTAYAESGVVIGHQRDDRGLAIVCSAGDLAFARGEKDEARPLAGVRIAVRPYRNSEINFYGGFHRFPSPRESFEIEVRVSGSAVTVKVDGEFLTTFRSLYDLPQEGHVGLFHESGKMIVENPAVRRHRVLGPSRTCACGHGDEPIELTRVCKLSPTELLARRVVGIPPAPKGYLALLFSNELAESILKQDAASACVGSILSYGSKLHGRDQLLLLYPASAGVDRGAVEKAWGKTLPAEQIHAHAGFPEFEKWCLEMMTHRARQEAGQETGPAFEKALKRIKEEGLTSPPYLLLDNRGYIRSVGVMPMIWGIGGFSLLVRLSSR